MRSVNDINIFILVIVVLASITGVFGQSMAYFMNSNFVSLAPINYLTALTVISVVFFIFSFILALKFISNKVYSLLIAVVGACISIWSLFVLLLNLKQASLYKDLNFNSSGEKTQTLKK